MCCWLPEEVAGTAISAALTATSSAGPHSWRSSAISAMGCATGEFPMTKFVSRCERLEPLEAAEFPPDRSLCCSNSSSLSRTRSLCSSLRSRTSSRSILTPSNADALEVEDLTDTTEGGGEAELTVITEPCSGSTMIAGAAEARLEEDGCPTCVAELEA